MNAGSSAIEVSFTWCRDEKDVGPATRLFTENISESYISHSELQSYRALAPDQWNPSLGRLIEDDIRGRLNNPVDAKPGEATQIAVLAHASGRLAGVFLVTFARDCAVPHAVLEDMVVAPTARSQGIGSKFIRWIENECQSRSIFRLFLESGNNNHSAHELFERRGFKQISVVMMKELSH